MFIYDSKSATLKKINPNQINFYACGPTVYDFIHIGNARPIIISDIMVRFLEYSKVSVNYLMNITDVDDKIVAKALAEGTTKEAVAKKFSVAFNKNLFDLEIRIPNKIIPISEKMNDIIEYINTLVEKDFAYEVNGNVYFDVEKMLSEYGKISKQSIKELKTDVRIINNSDKKNSYDFTLWKKTEDKKDWVTKWSKGRPGWHTECAVLINEYFGKTIDIHLGGMDLKFPHHENERIQALAINNKELSENWIHVGHVNVNGNKMSKSIGNTIFLNEFMSKYSNNVIRYLFSLNKYSQPIDLTEDLIQQAVKWEEKVSNILKKINWSIQVGHKVLSNDTPIDEDFNSLKFITRFKEYMSDDLNIPMVISLIDEIIKHLNKQFSSNMIDNSFEKLRLILKILGFRFSLKKLSGKDIEDITKWHKAIEDKEFKTSDSIRDELTKKGVF